jgi:hypothetical protein
VILLQRQGRYAASLVTDRYILCKQCGGVFGDPFESLASTRKTLRISHYGGSNDRWGCRHIFQYRDGDWFLIGATTTEANSATGDSTTTDQNLLTGDPIVTTEKAGKKVSVKKSKAPPQPLKKLRELSDKDLGQ